ncbi:MAG: asparaginase [Longimicrobiales bacterium]
MAEATVDVWRGALIESRHRVSVAVCDAGRQLRARCGDPDLLIYARSAIKPYQALPLVEDGVAERFALSAAELALCCASHSGEARHIDVAQSLLRKIGAAEEALACGAHAPFHEPTARALRAAGEEPTRLHNNCSGKHAGMLALARHHGWSLSGYQALEHPVQQRMLHEVSRWIELPVEEIPAAVDGCGVATFAGPLRAFAFGFARFAAAARRGEMGPARIVAAMTRNPEYVGGSGRFCTELMRVTAGRIFVKVGAEGVYLAGAPGAELGIAVKVEDGAQRAAEPALISVLRALSLLTDDELAGVARFVEPVLHNTRNEEVGAIRAALQLEPGHG